MVRLLNIHAPFVGQRTRLNLMTGQICLENFGIVETISPYVGRVIINTTNKEEEGLKVVMQMPEQLRALSLFSGIQSAASTLPRTPPG